MGSNKAIEFKNDVYRNYAPFGVRTKRFECLGFHPDLDVTGSMKKDKGKLGPGQYNPQCFECAYKKYNKTGSSWKRKKELEEFSRELGFKFPHVLEERRFLKSLGGPGTNDLNEDLFKRQTASIKKDADFGSQKRFYSAIKNNNPPPDTYFRDITKHSTVVLKQTTTVPRFEWDGFIDRFKSADYPWSKAPNRYTLKDRGINALLAKKVSKRGPYDLFTGPRDETTIKNHFSPPTFKGPENWFHTWPNEIDILLHHPRKRRCGRFLKGDRFPKYPSIRMMLTDLSLCYRDPNSPSPATYELNTHCIKKKPESMYPFNDSKIEPRKGIEWKIHPGPGRYNVKHPKCGQKHRQSWVFKSKTQRNMYKFESYTDF